MDNNDTYLSVTDTVPELMSIINFFLGAICLVICSTMLGGLFTGIDWYLGCFIAYCMSIWTVYLYWEDRG
jgi:hypothetical protein